MASQIPEGAVHDTQALYTELWLIVESPVPSWKGVWLEYLFQCPFTSVMYEEGWSGHKV